MNLAAVADMRARFPALDVILIESGGDNLAATFSPELADLTIYVIDRHEYRFPYDWGWSYRSSTNYVFAQIGGILFAVAGLALCWQARRSGKWIYGAIAIAAIALNYAIPDFCHIEPWLPPLRAVCGQEPG